MLLSKCTSKESSLASVTILLGLIVVTVAAAYQRNQEILDCTEGEDARKLCTNRNEAISKQKGRRQVESEVCASSLAQDGQPSIICSTTSQPSSNAEEGGEVNVSIRVPNNRTQFELGSSPTIECRAMASLRLGQDYELSKFKLRWLHNNRTIAANIATADLSTTIIGPSAARLWTVARDGGLDLEISDFRSSDAGNYTCQALNAKTFAVLDENVIRLEANAGEGGHTKVEQQEEAAVAASIELYSRSNLANLLPTIRVVPAFSEISPGDTVQLACVTSGLDPEPDPTELEWSFEWMPDNRELLLDVAPEAVSQLPVNVTIMGGGTLLIIWWATTDHIGLYRCRHHLDQFNLTSEAVGEIALRPSTDSAPLVFLEPELVRLPVNGTARVQCEATGYPRPTITWYRVEGSPTTRDSQSTDTTMGAAIVTSYGNEVEFEEVEQRDTSIYCRRNKCSAPNSSKVTGVSIVHLHRARAQHQGQWVCRADNKHGSNQASALVDVEFREAPRVRLVPNSSHQTILLSSRQGEQTDPGAGVATFRCLVEAGRPRPKLRWLRLAAGGSGGSSDPTWAPDNLDLYDLTQMSSATSNVSTRLVSSGTNQQELVLEVRTVSPEDEGAYVCVAENDWGRHSALAHLQVRRPAQVQIAQKSPWLAKPNDTFQLDCLVSGHPKPTDIEWSRPDRGAFFALISRGPMTHQQPEPSNINVAERAVLKFDRVGLDDTGEYECLARDPMNSTLVLRDTIMVVVEGESAPASAVQEQEQRLPRLVVSPTKATIKIGANLTLDCLAIGGLQPTLVEWQAPHVATWHNHHQHSNMTLVKSSASGELDIWPYYRSRQHQSTSLVQLGSKLRILNASKQHEGVYQCKGRNRAGVEVAPALVKLAEVGSEWSQQQQQQQEQENQNPNQAPAKTKVASLGSNIELKCQVSGVEEQPATSWSRDGQELPQSSLQIGHNLWIQNVSQQDGGLYVCSARSEQPDKIIQAKINLQVRAPSSLAQWRTMRPLKGRIVASKSQVNVGDSITLECIVSSSSNVKDKSNQFINEPSAMELEELERQVVWTNLHSGQSVFQDNVYVSNNLLVIYNLRFENSATYRCNYNELTQSTDYKLQVESSSSTLIAANGTEKDSNSTEQQHQIEIRQVPLGAQVELECAGQSSSDSYHWSRDGELHQRLGQAAKPLTFDSIKSHEADLYQCHVYSDGTSKSKIVKSILVQVLVPAARFLQKPVSFITLPVISGADQQLELELVLYPERDKGLILFSGLSNQSGDYISLGLNKGYLEFKFELGDGLTRLRSLQPLQLNQWHRALIERNRRGAVMWVDREPAVSNSSAGKFFNLNLDSVLYVGGHQHFLNSTKRSFQGYQRGFQGCISSLRIGRRQVELMGRNRSASMGIYECDKPQCSSPTPLGQSNHCSPPNGVCQVESSPGSAGLLRCICLPGFGGPQCQRSLGDGPIDGATTGQQTAQSSGACELLPQPPCSPNGTLSCQSFSKSSFKCHCKLGHVGDTCQEVAQFSVGADSSVWFNQLAYLHLRLNKPDDSMAANSSTLNEQANKLTKLGSMAESQSISFRLRTNSSYGLIFYLGQTWPELNESSSTLNQAAASQGAGVQTSKSMVANLLARLFTTVTDYLAIALVDGHVELSYELGSGVAILRSSRRVNDSQPHRIQVLRQGKVAKLIIDELHKHEGSSPGKLSMLNVPADVYLGGLPHLAELTHNMYMSGFVGCVSHLQLNSLGPLNLIQSDELAQVRSARNLAPCHLSPSGSSAGGAAVLEPDQATTTTAKPQPHKPWKAAPEPSEDPDEM